MPKHTCRILWLIMLTAALCLLLYYHFTDGYPHFWIFLLLYVGGIAKSVKALRRKPEEDIKRQTSDVR